MLASLRLSMLCDICIYMLYRQRLVNVLVITFLSFFLLNVCVIVFLYSIVFYNQFLILIYIVCL